MGIQHNLYQSNTSCAGCPLDCMITRNADVKICTVRSALKYQGTSSTPTPMGARCCGACATGGRPGTSTLTEPVAGNFYPVTSAIYVEVGPPTSLVAYSGAARLQTRASSCPEALPWEWST